MAVPLSPTRLIVCDGCQATFPFDPNLAGKKCRCDRCGQVLTMPRQVEKQAPQTVRQFSFACRLCETRMVANVKQVGKKARCPDCGVVTRIPEPPPVPKPKIPDAMHGQQYGVWGVDEAPSPEELKAMQPEFFPVYCRVCDTLMHAMTHQIGKELTCPDCGAKTLVGKPKAKKTKESPLVPDGDEYQLDELTAPSSRPVPVPLAVREGETRQSYRDVIQKEYGERAKMPAFPILQGVHRMLYRKPIPAWWLLLSISSLLMAGLLSMATNLSIFAVISLALAAIVSAVYFAGFSTICCSILTESAEGNDRMFHPPSFVFSDWFAESAYMGMALAISLVPGWGVGSFVDQPVVGLLIGFFLCFPITLLSSLEVGSPMAVVSAKLLSTLLRSPGKWLLFYIITGLVISASFLACTRIAGATEYAVIAIIPLGVGSIFLYFRILGRFAWWLTASSPVNRPRQE